MASCCFDTAAMGLSRVWSLRRFSNWIFAFAFCLLLGSMVFQSSTHRTEERIACEVRREVEVMEGAEISQPHTVSKALTRSDAFHDNCGKLTKNLPLTENQLKVSNQVEGYMGERRRRVSEVCKTEPPPRFSNNSIIDDRHGIFFCPVPKVASTFWTRVFYQLHFSDPVGSPFDVPVPAVVPSYFNKYKLKVPRGKSPNKAEVSKHISGLLRFTYVRDPLSRIFSAFVDKMLAPNPHHWRRWGEDAYRRYRSPSGKAGPKTRDGQGLHKDYCQHDTTFREFTALVIDVLWNKDVHTEPVSQRCSPCMFDFQVIGTMETFLDDALHILTKINMSETQIEFDRMEEDRTADAIEDSIKDSLSKGWLRMTLQCVTKDEILRRILRKIQIRGFISWRYKYPFTPEQAEIVDFEFYRRLLYQAQKEHYNKKELSLQKKQAFKEAFSTISNDQFKKLKQLYKADFAMFGFPKLLPENADVTKLTEVNTNAFDYSKDWDLSPLL